jgi:hypothetical protein
MNVNTYLFNYNARCRFCHERNAAFPVEISGNLAIRRFKTRVVIRREKLNSKHRQRVHKSAICFSLPTPPPALLRSAVACWDVSQTLLEERTKQMNTHGSANITSGRSRPMQVKFYVTEVERDLIDEKMRLVGTSNVSAYLRKMAIDGYVIVADHTDLKAIVAAMQKIGVNINQIAKRINTTSSIYQDDIEQVQKEVAEIWRLLRLSLLRQR